MKNKPMLDSADVKLIAAAADAEALKKSRVGGKELKPSISQAEKTGRGDCVRTQRHVQQGARCSGG